MYGLYSGAACNQEWLMMARVWYSMLSTFAYKEIQYLSGLVVLFFFYIRRPINFESHIYKVTDKDGTYFIKMQQGVPRLHFRGLRKVF